MKYNTYLKADNGEVFKVIQYKTGKRVEIPVNKDGSVKWFDDTKLLKQTKNNAS